MGGGWSDKTIPGGWMNKTISMLSSTPVEVDVELGNIEGLDPIPRLEKTQFLSGIKFFRCEMFISKSL